MKDYTDIIDLLHFHAPGRPYMSNSERAAQFMPFKSLKGYDELVEDSTEVILDTEERQIVDLESKAENWEDFSRLAAEDDFE